MGCGPSVPDAPRPEPHPFDASAIELTLVKKGSMNEVRLARAGELKSGMRTRLELESHPGWGIVAKAPETGPHKVAGSRWLVVELGVGKADGAAIIDATFDTAGFITSCHAPNNGGETPSMVFDIEWWKYEDGASVQLIGEAKSNEKTRDAGGGRTFVLNADGSVSPAMAPHLALGFQLPDCTLVSSASPNKVILADPNSLRGGGEAPLLLSTPPGYAICPKFDPRRIDEWRVSYQHWGIGPAQCATYARLDGELIRSAHPSSRDFVLDVPFDKRVEGCDGMPMAVIHFDSESQNNERKNAARRFTINADGSISPARSPHLALGLREGAGLMPLPQPMVGNVPLAVAVAIPVEASAAAVGDYKAVA